MKTADSPRTVLTVRGLSKTFVGQKALDAVDLELRAGEVHALLGQNGCGKSTLIKCLAGFHHPDDGAEITLDGTPITLPFEPARAAAMGLVFVHQDLGLIPNLSITENFEASKRYSVGLFSKIRWSKMRANTIAELALLGHPDLDPDTPVGRLPIAQQTIVAIARALSSAGEGAKILVLDEPTAALPDSEAALLFKAVRRVVDRGVAVLYVTHKLEELAAFADRATILRDGRNVETVEIADTDRDRLVRLIVGRDVEAVPQARGPGATGRELLDVRGISGKRLRDVSFKIGAGEIIGVAGMLGSGRSELARILFGAQEPVSGTISVNGKECRFRTPRDAVARKIALIPENRRRDGGVLDMSVGQNLTMTSIGRFWRGLNLSKSSERTWVSQKIGEYDVRPASSGRLFKVLSGGNQQKVVIAKWLETDPDIVIFDEPVQGVDIGARAEIFDLINKAAERGAAVVLISSEIEQMIALSHRILILRHGRIVADESTADLTAGKVTQSMYFDGERTKETTS
ncbi:sugar ABC transporter ATP-binding protein [Arthrobacter sp. efr-133-TYG-120]|uniref:sugar ABC transporter ATP-binding protein n=1 Tax=Arthrobacter sp. efr-133-TYG-120 TaxID=3040280 RepID=UPI00254C6A2C|nr:sugar ABC transporter ATP-binding protein [Arthrobacter sp. efr-133-TYG-120]